MYNIYEGAAGLGRLSSYEPVNGFGATWGSSGGGGALVADCPPTTSTFLPPGTTSHYAASLGPRPTLCNQGSNANTALCNNTAEPRSCYMAREYNMSDANRVSSAEIAAWRAWKPAGAPSPVLGDRWKGIPGSAGPGGAGAPTATSDSDDTMLYVGLGVAAVVVIGGAVWWKKKQKAKMAANRRRRSRGY